jgi:ribosomal protein S18 acetylase RimI-like enzyme
MLVPGFFSGAAMSAVDHIRIRQALIDDLRDVQAIARNTYIEHFAHAWSGTGLQSFLQREFSDEALRASLSSPAHAWFLLEASDDSVMGYAKVNWSRIEPVTGRSGAELQKIYFSANATGRGFGTALLAHVVAAAIAEGEPMLWLNVLRSNADAHRFYAAHGFETVGQIPFRADLGEEIGMWAMIRPLG